MDYMVNRNGIQILIEEDPVELKKKILKKYKEIRKSKKLSQEQVALAAGMARPDVSRFESGRYNPSLEVMIRYAHALGCELKIELIPNEENVTEQAETEQAETEQAETEPVATVSEQ